MDRTLSFSIADKDAFPFAADRADLLSAPDPRSSDSFYLIWRGPSGFQASRVARADQGVWHETGFGACGTAKDCKDVCIRDVNGQGVPIADEASHGDPAQVACPTAASADGSSSPAASNGSASPSESSAPPAAAPAPHCSIAPTCGRMVHVYRNPDAGRGSDGNFEALLEATHGVPTSWGPGPLPAVVIRADQTGMPLPTMHVRVIGDRHNVGFDDLTLYSIPIVDADSPAPAVPFYARWMPYQQGQAKKTEAAEGTLSTRLDAVEDAIEMLGIKTVSDSARVLANARGQAEVLGDLLQKEQLEGRVAAMEVTVKKFEEARIFDMDFDRRLKALEARVQELAEPAH